MRGPKELAKLLSCAFSVAKEELGNLQDGSVALPGGKAFGHLEHDIEIKADNILGYRLREFFSEQPEVGAIVVEGIKGADNQPEVYFTGRQGVWVYIDPLDNSQGFRVGDMAGDRNLWPYACVVTIAPGEHCRFSDLICGGIVDLRRSTYWLAWKNANGIYDGIYSHPKASEEKTTGLEPGKQLILTDFYYHINRIFSASAFTENGGFRNSGCAALDMAMATLPEVALYFCFSQKCHELGAAYVINRAFGCEVLHILHKKDLGEFFYNFNIKLPVLITKDPVVREAFFFKVCTYFKRD
jgi:hypothetical protein